MAVGGGKPPRNSQGRPTAQSSHQDGNHQKTIWRVPPSINFDDMSADASSDFFSPQPVIAHATILPRRHDTSWIGARQSPIPSFDDEDDVGTMIGDDDDDDDDESSIDSENSIPQFHTKTRKKKKINNRRGGIAEKYQRALRSSLQQHMHYYENSKQDNKYDDETTYLLESGNYQQRNYNQYSSIEQKTNNINNNPRIPGILMGMKNNPTNDSIQGNIHPLWKNRRNGIDHSDDDEENAKYDPRRQGSTEKSCHGRITTLYQKFKWGHALLFLTFSYLIILTVDEFSWVWSLTNQDSSSYSSSWYGILAALYQVRDANTVIKWGGMYAHRIIYQQEYWRLLTSPFMCASFMEFFLLCAVWNICIYGNPTYRAKTWTWIGTYFGAVLVGQFWMLAWDREASTATAATWGTCGILTWFGIDRPAHRDLCFLATIGFIIMAWWELPCNSVYGVAGASFFGWISAVTAESTTLTSNYPRPSAHVRMVLLLACVMAPMLHVAFQSDGKDKYRQVIRSLMQ